jgi:hypothetical protein
MTAMRPIIVATPAGAPVGPSADSPAFRPAKGAEVRRMLEGAKAPIHLDRYCLSSGTGIEWDSADRCRTLFVETGAIAIAGRRFPTGSVIIVEAGAHCLAMAEDDETELLEFRHNRGAEAQHGGHVHAVAGGDSPVIERDGISSSVHADATCPGCGVWLHENHIRKEGMTLDLHSHTEDEVIVVLEGEMIAGPRRLWPGAALSVAKNTLYAFTVGDGGLRFINFRPSRPGYIAHGSGEVRDELTIYTGMGLRPAVHAPL